MVTQLPSDVLRVVLERSNQDVPAFRRTCTAARDAFPALPSSSSSPDEVALKVARRLGMWGNWADMCGLAVLNTDELRLRERAGMLYVLQQHGFGFLDTKALYDSGDWNELMTHLVHTALHYIDLNLYLTLRPSLTADACDACCQYMYHLDTT